MAHAQGMTAITNPTVNSYKRLNASMTSSGATWSPSMVTYGGNNRTTMMRIPDAGRFEMRLADGAANPYLFPAVLLAAGMDGIENKLDPGKRVDLDMFSEGHKVRGAKKLPLNLLDALRDLGRDKGLCAALGQQTVDAFIKLKMIEWNAYTAHLSQWERDNTLDC
jgi:glutamine synthetase